MESWGFVESLLNIFDCEQGVLVGGAVDYDMVDLIDGSQVKVKNTDFRVKNLVNALELHSDSIKSLMGDLENPNIKLTSESLNTRAMQKPELFFFLYQQHTNTYKPTLLDKQEVREELMPILREYVSKTEGVKDSYKIDFLYYDSHCLPFSLRFEDGKIHVVSVDYIQYPNIVIEDVFKNDAELKDKFVYHYFSPQNQMQADGVSCSIHGCYALKEISALSNNDLFKMLPVNEEMAVSDFQKLSPNLIRLCQVVSVLDKYMEQHPNVKITHKNKSDELLSDYLKRHEYQLVKEDSEKDGKTLYKLIKTNAAVHKKALKVLAASINLLKSLKNDNELYDLADKIDDEMSIKPIKC